MEHYRSKEREIIYRPTSMHRGPDSAPPLLLELIDQKACSSIFSYDLTRRGYPHLTPQVASKQSQQRQQKRHEKPRGFGVPPSCWGTAIILQMG